MKSLDETPLCKYARKKKGQLQLGGKEKYNKLACVKWLPRCWSRCLQPVREGEEGGGPPVLYVGKNSEQSDISRPNMLSTACKMGKNVYKKIIP